MLVLIDEPFVEAGRDSHHNRVGHRLLVLIDQPFVEAETISVGAFGKALIAGPNRPALR